MSFNPPPFTASFNARDTFSHVVAFSNLASRNSLITFMESLDGTLRGDWWVLPTQKAVDDVVRRTQALGGISYFLNVDGPI